MALDRAFWEDRYSQGLTGWDIGYASPQLVHYFQQIAHKDTPILIPGCGYGHEAIVLEEMGFSQVTVVDVAAQPLDDLQKRSSGKLTCIQADFFGLNGGQYDLIIEQTFFSAIHPTTRAHYAQKMAELLTPKGRLAGLLFDVDFGYDGPPFGGSRQEYVDLFSAHFDILTMEVAPLSIQPRAGRELFFEMEKSAKN